ncbi:hypothetical protein BC941DRAFT_433206 [Chlamydoabsidia padenii]|nr:hypothetical protein BC941DRAFT_433206 [Chlamydoabsidia padenii]
MFHSKKQIAKRHGRFKPDRLQYLQLLVQEYTTTDNIEAKHQVLANLANFSYDPVNYDWLWEVSAVDLFLDAISQDDQQLQEFGMGGLANICLEPRHHYYIVSNPSHLDKISNYIRKDSSGTTNTLLNAMVTLMLLLDSDNQPVILTDDLKKHLNRLRTDTDNPTTSKMADLFLNDYYQT